MVVGLLGNESSDSNRFILVTPKPENGVRLQATLGNQNPTGLPVGAVRCIGIFIVSPLVTELQKSELANSAYAPMISSQARTDYQNGKITRDVAKERIDSHLESLKTTKEIEEWQYNDNTQKYLITLNDGSRFTYVLK